MRKLPAFHLIRQPLDEEAAAIGDQPFRSAGEGIGDRNFLGGAPSAPLRGGVPPCPVCDEEMSFNGHLDSISDDFEIVDVWVIHVYLCFDCFEVQAELSPR